MKSHFKKIAALGAVVAGLAAMGGYAYADTGTQTTTVQVNNTLALTGLDSSFALTGNPGDTATATTGFTVTTNNPTGYTATIQAASAALTGAISGNTDTIGVSSLGVNVDGGGWSNPITNTAAWTLATTAAETSASGDTHTINWHMVIPFREADTYSGTLDYTAIANP